MPASECSYPVISVKLALPPDEVAAAASRLPASSNPARSTAVAIDRAIGHLRRGYNLSPKLGCIRAQRADEKYRFRSVRRGVSLVRRTGVPSQGCGAGTEPGSGSVAPIQLSWSP
jgi:hypothetical protein